MSWFSRLFSKSKPSAVQRSPRSLSGKRVALAVVDNPSGAKIIGMSSGGGVASGVTTKMVRDFIEEDLVRYPELHTHAVAIQDIVILTDEDISSANYAQDMTQCYLKHMGAGDWAKPEGLHIFETLIAQVTVYIAYGT